MINGIRRRLTAFKIKSRLKVLDLYYGSTEVNLPSHIKGHTFKIDHRKEINWKKVKKDMKIMRKNMKHVHGIILTTQQMIFLMKWLEYVVNIDGLDD